LARGRARPGGERHRERFGTPGTVGTGRTLLTQATDTRGDTYWVQYRTAPVPAAGTTVTINDTAPTHGRWNLSMIEID